ncbi:unnamed protein product [Caenorhabditis nigoni]
MDIRKSIGNISVFCKSTTPKSVPKRFREAIFIYIRAGNLSKLCHSEKIKIPSTEDGINVYMDKNNDDLYLTNFVYDQSLLHHPINAISVFNDRAEIYVNGKMLDITLEQTSQTLQTEQQFIKLFLESNMDEPPQIKRPRISNQSQKVKKFSDTPVNGLSSSISTEFGVRTVQESQSSISNPTFQNQEGEEISDNDSFVPDTQFSTYSQEVETEETNAIISPSEHSIISDANLRNTNSTLSDLEMREKTLDKFPKSALDQKTMKDQQVSTFSQTVKNLLTKDKVDEKEIIVSTTQLNVPQKFDDTDATIQRMRKELEESSEIKKFDPIVVIKNDNDYTVISGRKRVMAYKSLMISKIGVSEINSKDGSKYRSSCFFRSMQRKENTVDSLLAAIHDLFDAVQLTKETVASWTAQQKNKVFGTLFQPRDKLGQLLEISLIPELGGAMTRLSLSGLQCSTKVLHMILMKHKLNPNATISLITKNWKTENDLKIELSRVMPCTRFILAEKKIEKNAIDDLMSMFGDEPEFIKFVRKTDMRAISRSKQFHVLKAKYESHKQQSTRSTSRKSSKSTKINIADTDVHFEVFITANENGRINNHMNIQILIKMEGNILNSIDASDYLRSHGVSNRTVFSTEQIRQLTNIFNIYYIDFGGLLRADLVTLLVTPSTSVFVPKTVYQQQLEKCMKQSGSDNLIEREYND